MIKRILSLVVTAVMILSCLSFVVSAEPDTRYEGIKYFQSAEDMLASLNADSADSNNTMWDYNEREFQQNIINAAAEAFDTDFTAPDVVDRWETYCERILSRDTDGVGDRDGYVLYYLKMLDIYKKKEAGETLANAGEDAVYADFKEKHEGVNVGGLSLADSLAQLEGYTDDMLYVISRNRAALDSYILTGAKKTEYMLHGTKALYQIAFTKTASDMSNAFNNEFLGDDEGKKLIAVMYAKHLTSELATDNISAVLINYINGNVVEVKNEYAKLVKTENGALTEEAIFTFFENTVVKAYEESDKSPEIKADIKMLFGDPSVTGDKGALQLMFEALESSSLNNYGMLNTWLNLFLRQHTQLKISGSRATNLEAGVVVDDARVTIKNNSSAVFSIENLGRYGISENNEFIALGSDWLDIKVYNEDRTLNNRVTYSKEKGRFIVYIDSEKPSTYPGYVQLVRNDGTYIETYPVLINNVASAMTPPSVSSEKKYQLSYDSNGGTDIFGENYSIGDVVKLTKIPVKEGYIFEGWYSDAALTNAVTEVVITKNTKIYAKWVEDNGLAGGNHPIPEMLNGEDHFAYIMGYPDGTVKPGNNITRAEVASIFFRLLKDDVRESNLTQDNDFSDVNDGDWYNTAVSTLVKLSILNGRSATEFDPNAHISRAEFATICARFDNSEYLITDNFTDISGHWAESYIRESAARGWVKGYEDDTFRPDRSVTRAEAITMINRMLKRVPEGTEDLEPSMTKWSDCAEDAWYFIPVQEATNSHTHEMKNNVYEKWTALELLHDWTQYEK